MKKLLVLLMLPFSVMAFTPAERAQLKTVILAEPSLQECVANGQTPCIQAWLNSETSTVVWKSSVTLPEIYQSADWDWTRVDNLTTGEARIWDEMFDNDRRAINPSFAKVRAGIEETWKGTALDETLKTNAIYPKLKRFATQAEKVFATGTGTSASPATLTYEGPVSDYETSQIMSQP